jgi:hypothetical protein
MLQKATQQKLQGGQKANSGQCGHVGLKTGWLDELCRSRFLLNLQWLWVGQAPSTRSQTARKAWGGLGRAAPGGITCQHKQTCVQNVSERTPHTSAHKPVAYKCKHTQVFPALRSQTSIRQAWNASAVRSCFTAAAAPETCSERQPKFSQASQKVPVGL